MSSYCQNIGMNLTLLEILEDLINFFSRAERPPARHGTARHAARHVARGTARVPGWHVRTLELT